MEHGRVLRRGGRGTEWGGGQMQRHDCRITFLFYVNGRPWRVAGECSLYDMELLQGRRLELGVKYEVVLPGHALVLREQGLLVLSSKPGSAELSEFTHGLWAFPSWLKHLESIGTNRSDVVGSSDLQALEWYERYLQWAHDEEYRHLEHLTAQGKSLDELELWWPELRDNPLAAALVDDLERNSGLAKRGRGRPAGSMGAAIRELYALAVDIYRHDVPGMSDSWLAACWEACRLRPEWVPRQWAIKGGIDEAGNALGPGMSLYRATNKASIRCSPLSDPVHWPAPEYWPEYRPPGWRGSKGK